MWIYERLITPTLFKQDSWTLFVWMPNTGVTYLTENRKKAGTEEVPCNHCCSGISLRITYSESVCVCSLSYPACNAHEPCCHLRPARLYHIFFPNYLIKRQDFRVKVIKIKMCVLIFSATFVWNISHCKKNWARYDQKCTSVFTQNTSYCCPVLMKLEFSRQTLHENPSSGSLVVSFRETVGRTDINDGANNHFSQFCERA